MQPSELISHIIECVNLINDASLKVFTVPGQIFQHCLTFAYPFLELFVVYNYLFIKGNLNLS